MTSIIFSIRNMNRPAGLALQSVLLDKNDLGQVVQDQNVIDSEERTFGEYQGVYLKYNSIAKKWNF